MAAPGEDSESRDTLHGIIGVKEKLEFQTSTVEKATTELLSET